MKRHISVISRSLVYTNSPTSANSCMAKFGRRCATYTKLYDLYILCALVKGLYVAEFNGLDLGPVV